MSLFAFFRRLKKSKKEKSVTPQVTASIQRLHETEDVLRKKSDLIEARIENEVAAARKHAASNNKRLAVSALRRKKQLENALREVDNQISTLELQREALENASSTTEVTNAFRFATNALRSAHNRINVASVYELMETIGDQTYDSNEIMDAMSRSVGCAQVDESELLAELEELENDEQIEKPLVASSGSRASGEPLDAKLEEGASARAVSKKVAAKKRQQRLAANCELDDDELQRLDVVWSCG